MVYLAKVSSCFFFSSSSCDRIESGALRKSDLALTFFKCWNRSKKEPSLEKTLVGLGLGAALGFDVWGVPAEEGLGEAYPLDG